MTILPGFDAVLKPGKPWIASPGARACLQDSADDDGGVGLHDAGLCAHHLEQAQDVVALELKAVAKDLDVPADDRTLRRRCTPPLAVPSDGGVSDNGILASVMPRSSDSIGTFLRVTEWQDLNLRPPRPERGALPGQVPAPLR